LSRKFEQGRYEKCCINNITIATTQYTEEQTNIIHNTNIIITYRIYINDNRLVTYNDIPTFIIDLLNHQATLINMIVPVTLKVLQSALHSDATL